MLNQILTLITLLSLISCANTRTIYKDKTYPAKVSTKNGKYKSIEIVEIKTSTRFPSISEQILNEGSEFYAQSFKNTLEKMLIDSKKFKVIHRASNHEIIHNKLAQKRVRSSKANLGIYGTYQENQGIEAYSQDATGKRSHMLYASGRFTFKLVENKSGEVLYTDTISWKNRSPQSSSGVFLGSTTTETLAQAVRERLSHRFISLFSPQTLKIGYEFKEGKDGKFTKVIEYVNQGSLNEAMAMQNSLLSKLADKEEISDAHYNKALIYLLKNDKESALKSANSVVNGFINKDFDNLRRKILSL